MLTAAAAQELVTFSANSFMDSALFCCYVLLPINADPCGVFHFGLENRTYHFQADDSSEMEE